MGRWIIFNIFLSKIQSIFPTFFERGRHSLPYVSIGLVKVLYNIYLVWRLAQELTGRNSLLCHRWCNENRRRTFALSPSFPTKAIHPVSHSRKITTMYRVIHKSLREFRPLRYSSRDGRAEEEHFNRGRDTPSFCLTLQVLDMSALGDAADVNPVIMFMPHTFNVGGRVDISSTCKVGQKIGVSVPLLTCSRSAWPSRLLYRRGRNSRRDLWITLYNSSCYW